MTAHATETAGPSPFFVIGPVRSGTTLVERILNRHSGIVVPPETYFFSFLDRAGALGRGPLPAAALPALLARYRAERACGFLGLQAEDTPALLRGARNEGDLFRNLMELLRRRAGKRRWGEKTPDNLRYVDPIRRRFPGARFVLLVRDGRAAVLSRVRHPVWTRNLLGAARHWATDARVMRRLMAELGPATLFVLGFEALLREPERSVRALCDFLGEPFEPAMLQPEGEASPAGGYYRQPWMAKSTTEIDPRRADEWQRDYSPQMLRVVEAAAGEQLEALGYPLLRPHAPGWRLLYLREEWGDLRRRLANRLAGRSRLRSAARA